MNAAGEAGGWTQLGRQAVLAVVGIAYPFLMTWIVLWVTDHTVGLRVSPGKLRVSPGKRHTASISGEHGEVAYQRAAPAADMTSAGMAAAQGSPYATEAP